MRTGRALLLAAGRGTRAGGPKAWREREGRPLLEQHLEFFRGLLGPGALSVAIQPEWRERCAALSGDVVWVDADADAPPLDTLQRLIAASPAERSFVLHVDMPVFDAAVYRALWASEAHAAVPLHAGRRGHPVLLSPQALAEVAGLDAASERLDNYLRLRRADAVPVDSPLVLANLNEAAR